MLRWREEVKPPRRLQCAARVENHTNAGLLGVRCPLYPALKHSTAVRSWRPLTIQSLIQTPRISTFSQNEPDFKRQEEILEKVARELKLYACNHFEQTAYCLTDSLTLEERTHMRNK